VGAVGFILAITGCSSTGASSSISGKHVARLVAVPATVTNNYPAQASAALCAAGPRPLYVTAPPILRADSNTNGYAVKTAAPIAGNEVATGSTVRISLAVSSNGGGPWTGTRPSAVLPSVIGRDANQAISDLTLLGLHVNVRTTTPTAALTVTQQIPTAGTHVRGGSIVTIRVGQRTSRACP
jgi:beta-lactam-binding protein with PASTA domain